MNTTTLNTLERRHAMALKAGRELAGTDPVGWVLAKTAAARYAAEINTFRKLYQLALAGLLSWRW